MTRITVRLIDIPLYLQESELYRTLEGTCDTALEIPSHCLHGSSQMSTVAECTSLYHTMRYWGLDLLTHTMLSFLLEACSEVELTELITEFKQEFPYLSHLPGVRSNNHDLRETSAISTRRIEVMEYLSGTGHQYLMTACEKAAALSSPSVLRYLHTKGTELSDDVCNLAAEAGCLPCLQYAHEHGCALDTLTCTMAAYSGSLDCLKYAHEHGGPWDADTCLYAAMNNHLQCLKYALNHGCPISEEITMYAASEGRLECLQYLYEYECIWHPATCEHAAAGGHLACLRYAHEHDCPWDESVPASAARHGHLACLRYAYEQGCPWDAQTVSGALQRKAATDDDECLGFALAHGCPVSPTDTGIGPDTDAAVTAKAAGGVDEDVQVPQYTCMYRVM